MKKNPFIVHCDLDGLDTIYRAHGWPLPEIADPIYETGMRNLLSFLNRNRIKATLFLIARDLDDPRKLEWVRQAQQQGHEIASHSLNHPNLRLATAEEKFREVSESKEKIEKTLGSRVNGFRAPGYQTDRVTCEFLARCGYLYDSSVILNAAHARQMATSLSILAGGEIEGENWSLRELVIPYNSFFPFPFNPSYSLLIGLWYFKLSLSIYQRKNIPFVLLFHLIDFADPLLEPILASRKAKIFTLSHLRSDQKEARCQKMFEAVRRHHQLTSTLELLKSFT